MPTRGRIIGLNLPNRSCSGDYELDDQCGSQPSRTRDATSSHPPRVPLKVFLDSLSLLEQGLLTLVEDRLGRLKVHLLCNVPVGFPSDRSLHGGISSRDTARHGSGTSKQTQKAKAKEQDKARGLTKSMTLTGCDRRHPVASPRSSRLPTCMWPHISPAQPSPVHAMSSANSNARRQHAGEHRNQRFTRWIN